MSQETLKLLCMLPSLEPRLSIPDFVLQLWRKTDFSPKLQNKIWNGKPWNEATCCYVSDAVSLISRFPHSGTQLHMESLLSNYTLITQCVGHSPLASLMYEVSHPPTTFALSTVLSLRVCPGLSTPFLPLTLSTCTKSCLT